MHFQKTLNKKNILLYINWGKSVFSITQQADKLIDRLMEPLIAYTCMCIIKTFIAMVTCMKKFNNVLKYNHKNEMKRNLIVDINNLSCFDLFLSLFNVFNTVQIFFENQTSFCPLSVLLIYSTHFCVEQPY